MTDSLLAADQRDLTSTRVDEAHDLLSSAQAKDENWLAMAGRDPQATATQLDRQTNELLAYVQQQSEEIDSRQSELNAKLAQLDNELRAARLASLQVAGADLLDMTGTRSTSRQHASPPSGSAASASNKKSAASHKEFDEFERIVAEISHGVDVDSSGDFEVAAVPHAPLFGKQSSPPEDSISRRASGLPFDSARGRLDPRQRLEELGPSLDFNAMATSLDAEAVESEKRLLAERKIELDRRKSVLQRMQDETQALHREALEMRLITEQVWAELSDKVPSDHLTELLSSLRARLDEHYVTMNNTLQERKGELVTLKHHLQEKQLELRGQSQKLQEWVESRHDEIKHLAAQLDAREMLLDRREHRLQEEFSKWEAQRSGYKQQLQGLLRKLSLAGLSEPGA